MTATEMTSRCTVEMDGEGITTDEFVAVVPDEECGAHVYYNADALLLGMAVQMLAVAFEKAMAELSEDVRAEIHEILNLGGNDEQN